MVSEASSSTSSGLKVLGSPRRQKWSSPPDWTVDSALTNAGQDKTRVRARTIQTRRIGFAESVEKSSKPRSKFPQDGIGSITPSPKMLKFASVKMNNGIEIQNCA